MKNYVKLAIFIGLFIFLAILRFHNYSRYPSANHGEELLYGWAGIYLVETGVPQSWSTLEYPEENLVFDGIVGNENLNLPAKLYRPWLDEPPLYSLLVGWVSHKYGDNREEVLPVAHTRIPNLIAALFTTFLVFWVSYKMFGYKVGILAMMIFGTTPIFVFGSRLSVPENIMALGVMISVYLSWNYLRKPESKIAFVIGLMTIILGLMKPTGFFIAPIFMFLNIYKRRWKDLLIVTGSMLVGIMLLVAYGYHYDWELFKQIVSIQGGRYPGWTGLVYLFTSPAFDIFETFDGWYYWCLISAVILGWNSKKFSNIWLVAFYFVYWLLVALFGGSEQDLLPWYRFPFYPVLAILGSVMLFKVYSRPTFFKMVLLIGLLWSSRYYLHNDFRPTTPTLTYRLLYFGLLSPSLMYLLTKNYIWQKVSRFIIIVFVLVGLFWNSKYVYNVFDLECENKTCYIGKSSKLSDMKMPFLWRILRVNPDYSEMLINKRPKI